MTMVARTDEEKQLHARIDSIDSSSIHSFASSSFTLSNVNSDYQGHEDEKADYSPELDDFENGTLLNCSQPITSTSPPPLQKSSWRKTPFTPIGLTTLVLQLLLSLVLRSLPSFLFKSPTRRKIHPTSYLDGLRGIAALIVFLDHFVLNWFYSLRSGYLATPDDTSILQLPIIRLIFAGRASVGVFFVISGFVLSYKPLSLIRSGNKAGVLDTLASSIFRRGVRLYLPIVFGTLISAYLAQKEYFTPVPARTETIPPILPSMREQVHHWVHATQVLILAGITADPNHPYGPIYNGHLWTIPIEFLGSMVVFLAVLASSHMASTARMVLLSTLAGLGLRFGRWDFWLFLGGVVLAEWSLILLEAEAASDDLPTIHGTHFTGLNQTTSSRLSQKLWSCIKQAFRPVSAFKSPFKIALLLISLYLLSYAGESSYPGYYHVPLASYIPSLYEPIFLGNEHFILSLGAILLIFILTISPNLQSPFLSPFAQYLGDISYSLYIVHGLVLFTLGTGLQELWTGQVGEERWVDNGVGELVEGVVRTEVDGRTYGKAFLLCVIANTVAVFWAADLFWRIIDGRVIGVGRRIEGLFVRKGRN